MEMKNERMAAGEGKNDDLIIIRAAARAWYYRGPGSNRKPIREILYKSGNNLGQPSSHNTISAKVANNNNNRGNLCNPKPSPRPSPLQSKKSSSLLDSYEIEMISRHLNRLIESSRKDNTNLIMCRSYASQAHHDPNSYQKREAIKNHLIRKKKDVPVKPTNHGVSGKVGLSCHITGTISTTRFVHSTNQSKGMPGARAIRNISIFKS